MNSDVCHMSVSYRQTVSRTSDRSAMALTFRRQARCCRTAAAAIAFPKGCRDYFSADVVTAVDIGMDGRAPCDTIPAPIATPRELRFVLLIRSLGGIIAG